MVKFSLFVLYRKEQVTTIVFHYHLPKFASLYPCKTQRPSVENKIFALVFLGFFCRQLASVRLCLCCL